MNESYDAVVIGAGIVGAACAMEFAAAGMRVAIVERGTVGGDATAAGMGHIVTMDDSPAQFALTRYSQTLWAEMTPDLSLNVEYDRCGTLWVAQDDQELLEAERKCSAYLSSGVPAIILDATALAEAEPNLSRALVGALLVPEDAVLYPPAAALHLLRCALHSGAHFYEKKVVESAREGNVVFSDGTVLRSERIVNAAGASAASITSGLPIRKRKGHLVITDRYPGFCRHQIIELAYLKSAHSIGSDSVAFNLQPRRTGQLLLGSSRQFDAEDTSIDRRIVRAIIDRAKIYAPRLAALSALRTWTGFRAATPDNLPLIGPSVGDGSVYLATGHEGLGITTSLATARLLADHFLGRTSTVDAGPYLPCRFTAEAVHA